MKTPTFHRALFPSPLGGIVLVFRQDERLLALDFETHLPRMERLLRQQHRIAATQLQEAAVPAGIAAPLRAFFQGELTAVDTIPVVAGGTAFQRLVWSALRKIPAGTTLTYGELAARVGRRGASRAVGRANGANPIAIVVPCHRVIGADGTLTGYGGGVERKEWLLAHERRAAPRTARA
jgi:methylated-DNA-[protein]-cysteine S-methyltransferase